MTTRRSASRALLTLDCWDTLLVEPGELDAHIEDAISREILDQIPDLDRAAIGRALAAESERFAHQIRLAAAPVTTAMRVSLLLELLTGQRQGDGAWNARVVRLADCIDAAISLAPPKPMSWAHGFLSAAHDHGFAIYVLSNTGWLSASAVRSALESNGLVGHISGFYFSGQGFRPKPASEMFALAARHSGCNASDAIHVGDQLVADGQGGIAAGFRTVILLPDRRSNPGGGAPQAAGPILMVENLREAWSTIIAMS
jgi:FMN phosphatase YigB (HAD superfamily)